MPMRDEISLLPLRGESKQSALLDRRPIAALFRNPEFVAVCVFSAIGLLSCLVLAMQYPFSDEMVASLVQF